VSLPALRKIQSLVRCNRWIPSKEALGYIADGEFDEEDIRACIANGAITCVQNDERGEAVDGHKYVIAGPDKLGLAFEVCGKIIEWLDGQQFFVITAYPDRRQ
jgi:hypothetical protein